MMKSIARTHRDGPLWGVWQTKEQMMSDELESFIGNVTDDVKKEALVLLGDLAEHLGREAKRASHIGEVRLPAVPGGGVLDGMTLDEALSRAEGLDASVREKLEVRRAREELKGRIVSAVIEVALKTLVRGATAGLVG